MGRRSASAKFMARAWVFPGGRVDDIDQERAAGLVVGDNDPAQLPWIAAALRETVEEAGIWLTESPRVEFLGDRDVYRILDESGEKFVADVAYFAHWVTPADLPIRYDARFFATLVTADLNPIPDLHEIDDAVWVRPGDAILRAQGQWLVPFPTHVTLEQLARATSAAAFMEMTKDLAVETVQPRIKVEADGSLRVVMPGEPDFDDLPEASLNAGAVAEAARIAKESGSRNAEFE